MPVPATLISPLLMSACVSSTRFLSVSKRKPIEMRLKIGAVGDVLQAHRQEDVGGADLVGADIDRAHAIGGRPYHHPQRPGMCALFAETERHAAAAGPAQTKADVVKGPFVAALLIVDNQVAVLQT